VEMGVVFVKFHKEHIAVPQVPWFYQPSTNILFPVSFSLSPPLPHFIQALTSSLSREFWASTEWKSEMEDIIIIITIMIIMTWGRAIYKELS